MSKRRRRRFSVTDVLRDKGLVLFSDGAVAEVDTWLDYEGDECGPKDAIYCVAQHPGGVWANIEIEGYEPERVH